MKRIPLSRGLFALVDDEDFAGLSKRKWHAQPSAGQFRPVSNAGGGAMILMYREIMKPAKDELVDHVNRDPLDNRRENLRVCSARQNGLNRSGHMSRPTTSRFKGVCWDKSKGKWLVTLRNKFIGYYRDEIEAAKAYDKAAMAVSVEFALTNFDETGNERRHEKPTVIAEKPRDNSSEFKGVTWHRRIKKWGVRVNNKHCGYFVQEKDAASVAKTALEGAS